jgi:putative membrane protein
MKSKCMSKRLLSIVLIGTLAIPNMTYATELIQKDETVYVTLNQQGEVKERIVSDWIHSNEKSIEILDRSILKDIKNVKGEEKPNGVGENLSWKLEGNDIYYKGTTDKKLPIDINVKYLLDGKEIKPEDLPGKSGEVKIKIDYKNNESHMVNIKGKNRKIYTPFSTITIVDLPIDNFKNVKISSGKMISDGNNQIVTFICLPGMKDSLNLKESTLDLKENLEITAQVENFEMGPIMITGTPELPDMSEFKGASTLNDLIKGINDIQDASTKLAEGTRKLSVGQGALADNMTLFTSGISKIGAGALGLNTGMIKAQEGVNIAQNGAEQLAGGIKAFTTGATKFGSGAQQFGLGALDFATNSKAFADGSIKLADGTDKLVAGSKGLSDGANKLAEGTNIVSTKMESLSQGLDTMVASTEKLQQGQKQVIAGTEALIQKIVELQLVASKNGDNELLQELKKLELGIATIKAGSEQVNTGMGQLQVGEESASSGSKELAKATKQISDKTYELAKGATQLKQGGEQLGTAAETLKTGSQGLSGGANKLNVAAKDLSAGTKIMGESTQKLVLGSQSVVDGLTRLNNEGIKPLTQGTSKLNSSVGELSVGAGKLKEGADKLASGSKELDENMKKFNKEGIQKISSEIDSKMGSLEDIIDVKDELIKISDNYGTFSGLGEKMDGKVKFVMKTDEIKIKIAEVKDEKETVKEEKKGFFGWIKSLFSSNNQARK